MKLKCYNDEDMKTQSLHTIIWKEKNLFVAKFLEIEIVSQGKTKKEAVRNLKEALDLYLENEEIDNLSFPSIDNVTTQILSLS